MRILFVCTGNTCRSPMSAAMANHMYGAAVAAESAGIEAVEGEPASTQAVAVMGRRGIDLSRHSARRLTVAMLREADMVITMTAAQRAMVLELGGGLGDKVFLFSDLAADDVGNVVDPWSGSVERYEECAALIEGFLGKMPELFEEDE